MSAIPSHALVNFSRLMRSCDALAADLREEAARLRLAAYVPVLHSLFAQLEQEGCCAWDELDEYSRKVTRLAELLDEKRLTSGGGALAVARATSNPRLTRKQANAELSGRRTAANRVREALRAQLLHNDGAECVAEPELPPITCGEGTGFSSASPLLGPPILPAHTATVLASAASGASALDALLARAAIERPAAGADDGERQNGPAFDQNEGHTCSFSATATNDAAAAGAGGLCGSTDSAPRNAHSRSAAGAAGASKSVRFQPKEGRGAVRDSRGSCRGGESIAAASVEATLEAERNMQDSIVDDASVMVSELRERSLQARKAVRDDIATLDATGQLIEANRAKLDQNNERLREQIEQMRSSKCVTWLLVLVVCITFIGTYLLMKMFPKPKN